MSYINNKGMIHDPVMANHMDRMSYLDFSDLCIPTGSLGPHYRVTDYTQSKGRCTSASESKEIS